VCAFVNVLWLNADRLCQGRTSEQSMPSTGKTKGKLSRTSPKPRPSRKVIKGRTTIVRATPASESKKISLLAAEAALDKKASAVDIIDVTGKVDYADYLVLVTGLNERHVAAIARAVDEHLHKNGIYSVATEGLPAARWVLIDFVDVVVHVFLSEARTLYDLDGLWLDARRIPITAGASKPKE
jgi:ribosome-associated protein